MRACRSLPLLLLIFLAAGMAAATPTGTPPPEPIRVLFVGNSITYANNLPRLVRAVAASQPGGPAIDTATFVIPGAELDELRDDGHPLAALRDGAWDVVVLQERGGLLDCLARTERNADCRRSDGAHRAFVDAARQRGAKVLLLMTWPRARGGNDWSNATELRKRKEKLSDGYTRFARRLARGEADVSVVPAAGALYDFAADRPLEAVLADGVHPSVESSLLMAAQLYAAISGRTAVPADLLIDFPLLPANAAIKPETPMESQAQIAGDGSRYLIQARLLEPLYVIANENATTP